METSTYISDFIWSRNHISINNILEVLLVITFTSMRIYLFMLFKILCSAEGLFLNYCSMRIVFIWSSIRGDCKIASITTHCCSNISTEGINSMDLFIILDLTHWAAWEYLPLIWKHKSYLPLWGNSFVVCNLTYAIVSVAFDRIKWVVVYVAWTMWFFFRGVTHDWM